MEVNDQGKFDCEDHLLSEEFEKLLHRLDADRDRAGEKYEDLRRRLVRFFIWNDCFPGEDLADMTFDRAAAKLATAHINNISAFIWGVAKNIRREFYRRPEQMNIEDLPLEKTPQTKSPELNVIESAEKERLQRCLRGCIEELSNVERDLFIEYEHYATKARKMEALAERLQLTIGALRTRAHRIRHRVEVCTTKCFNQLQNQT